MDFAVASTWSTMLAAFLASLVEFVEALTVVLAVGVVRGWSGALAGAGLAFCLLFGLVVTLGPALTQIPLDIVQAVVGALLLLFGLRWLRKAILRAARVIALHDEGAAYEQETRALRQAGRRSFAGFDTVAIATAFKIVMLEGIEVVFIVIAVGSAGRMLLPASIGAFAALLLVIMLGIVVHRPLSRVPENSLKFIVGVLLSAFGTFWAGEGIGVIWPGGDVALFGLGGGYFLVAVGLVSLCRFSQARPA